MPHMFIWIHSERAASNDEILVSQSRTFAELAPLCGPAKKHNRSQIATYFQTLEAVSMNFYRQAAIMAERENDQCQR